MVLRTNDGAAIGQAGVITSSTGGIGYAIARPAREGLGVDHRRTSESAGGAGAPRTAVPPAGGTPIANAEGVQVLGNTGGRD
jgi:hypothetical protein